jgi:hypothetical protein
MTTKVKATVMYWATVEVPVGDNITPGALREAILTHSEPVVRDLPMINAIIVHCSVPEMEERKRFLRLVRKEKKSVATGQVATLASTEVSEEVAAQIGYGLVKVAKKD